MNKAARQGRPPYNGNVDNVYILSADLSNPPERYENEFFEKRDHKGAGNL